MKTRCLDDFLKSLENEVSAGFANELKVLIDTDDLSEESLTELIERESSDD